MKRIFLFIAIFFALSATVHAMDVTLTCDPNTEVDLAGYKIYSATTAGGPYTLKGSFNYGPNVTPNFPILGLPNTKTYFVATAFDTGGLESPYSNEVAAGPVNVPPAAPTNIRVTATK